MATWGPSWDLPRGFDSATEGLVQDRMAEVCPMACQKNTSPGSSASFASNARIWSEMKISRRFWGHFGGIAEFSMRLIKFLVIEVNVALEPGNLRCLSSLLRDIQPHPIQIFRIWGSPCITRVFAHFQRGRSVNSTHEGGITRRKSNLTKLSVHTLLTSYVPFAAFLSLAKTSFVT